MENSNSNKVGLVLGSLVIGAAIGGILGILFAPEKGSTTRKKIVGKADDLKKSISDKFNDLMAEAKEEFENEKEKAKEYVEQASEK